MVGSGFVDGAADSVNCAGVGSVWGGERTERKVGESEAGDGVDEEERCERRGCIALDVKEGIH